MLSRRYATGCIATDSQLIGGFLAALLIFMRNSQGGTSTTNCEWEEDGVHKLKDIGMSCSRWFIESLDDYTVALLLPNESPLIQESKYNVINDLADNIIATFVLFTTFGITEDIDSLKDFTDDFGNSVDNLVFESLNEYINPDIDFTAGGTVEVFDSNII